MAVSVPAAGVEVDLDVARARRFAGELQHRPAKIRPGFVIPKTGMKRLHLGAVQCDEFVAEQALVKPRRLQQPFWRRRGILAQGGNEAAERARARFLVSGEARMGHLRITFRWRLLQSQGQSNRNRVGQARRSRIAAAAERLEPAKIRLIAWLMKRVQL